MWHPAKNVSIITISKYTDKVYKFERVNNKERKLFVARLLTLISNLYAEIDFTGTKIFRLTLV